MVQTVPDIKTKTQIKGRQYFSKLYAQFQHIYIAVTAKNRLTKFGLNNLSDYFMNDNHPSLIQFKLNLERTSNITDEQTIIKRIWIDISFYFLFYGVSSNKEYFIQNSLGQYHNDYVADIFDELSKEKAKYDNRKDGFTKYHGGHLHRLGHYFRHLFQAVKFIDECEDLTPEEKYSYVKNLRAQLSSYEQIILYFNSLSELGIQWEFGKESNFYITKYSMIKNIPTKMLPFNMLPTRYYPLVPFEDIEFTKQNEREEFLKRIRDIKNIKIQT